MYRRRRREGGEASSSHSDDGGEERLIKAGPVARPIDHVQDVSIRTSPRTAAERRLTPTQRPPPTPCVSIRLYTSHAD